MERLFRDRMEYISKGVVAEGCFICEVVSSREDEANLVVGRTEYCIVLLNKYPYNTGHVIVSPKRHVGDITELTEAERGEVMTLTSSAVEQIRAEMQPHGFNLGANLGEVAGAGLPGHFHLHVVPRWAGDTNFMPVVGEAKVLPELLNETLKRLRGKLGA